MSTAISAKEVHLPPATLLERLALSDKGFVIDPVTGNSFSANASGLALLRIFQREREIAEIVAQLVSEYDLTTAEAERDVLDFAALLHASLRP